LLFLNSFFTFSLSALTVSLTGLLLLSKTSPTNISLNFFLKPGIDFILSYGFSEFTIDFNCSLLSVFEGL
jgi:hypothetical protein